MLQAGCQPGLHQAGLGGPGGSASRKLVPLAIGSSPQFSLVVDQKPSFLITRPLPKTQNIWKDSPARGLRGSKWERAHV